MTSNELVQKIKSAAKIEQIIEDYLPLKKAGSNFTACCPFHSEETASFTVSPAKGIYKCFGCGASGDVIKFVQTMEQVSFPEAVKKLGKRHNIDVPDKELSAEELAAHKRRENVIEDLNKQQAAFRDALPKNGKGTNWLLQERGITPETIDKWGLGYSESGFFAGRITYPIQNIKGELVGFTARRLNDNDDPKFKNSAESELYKKSELLYGLPQAKMKIHKADKCYIVEGQHDVLMMHQAGFENTVATSGTALTIEQIRLIKPWSKNIVLLMDGDKAGINAAIKHISTLLNEQVNLRIVLLPEGEDPDSFLRIGEGGKERGRAFIESNEIDFIAFKATHFNNEIKENPGRMGELINEITNDISLVNDKNIRAIYSKRCAEIFGIKEGELNGDIVKLRGKLIRKPDEGCFFAFEFEETMQAIEDAKEVNILTNFEAVIEYHLDDQKNYIGMNCIPLQKEEIFNLKKLTKKGIFNEIINQVYDPLTNEESPTILNLKRLVSFGFDIRMLTENNAKKKKNGQTVEADYCEDCSTITYSNFPDWYIKQITSLLIPDDGSFRSWVLDHIGELLSYLPESSEIVLIQPTCAAFKANGVNLIAGDLKKIIRGYRKKNVKSFEPLTEVMDISDNSMNLNPDQMYDLNHYQHYMEKNAIYHISKTGHLARISNFMIKPIIHTNTTKESFKLFEMVNEDGLKATISLDTKDLNDVRRFKCAVEQKGFFVFKGEQFQLDNIKERLYKHTTYSDEIEQLGWQSEGFWAWADGVTTLDGTFTKTDKNGLISIGDKNYLIKPFSNLYAQDKTAYINEKKFVHLTSDTTFKEWNRRYLEVFGDNSMILTCSLITAFYSDAIFKIAHGELPLINLFGPKGTGKTQQADSLLAFFGEKQPVNNLSKVTIYGLSQTLKSFHNAFCMIDEYKNSLDPKLIEMLKSIYNRQGKIQGNWANTGTKTEHIPINQMALICGQDLPTLDVALLERCICLTAYRNEYTDEQKNRYNELKDLEEKGLSHLTDEFLMYRELVIEQFDATNIMIQKMISERCTEVSVRLQKNILPLLTVHYILKDKFEFAFSFEQVFEFAIQTIQNQQKFIESSDDMRNFWSILMALIEQGKIKEGRNYILHNVAEIKFVGNQEKSNFPKGINCLFLRWDGLYPMYAEYARRCNTTALGEKTIQLYLEKTKYYLGKLKCKWFHDKSTNQKWNTQAYCFDYDKMNVNLIASENIEYDNVDMVPNYGNQQIQEIRAKNQEEINVEKGKNELPF